MKALNSRQAQWAIKLTAFNFVISHRLRKMNLTDALSRCSDYKDINETVKKLLLILQRKLVIMISVFAPVFSSTIGRVIAEVKDFVRCRNPELRNEPLRSDRKTSAQHICNIAEEQLNPVAETVDCKQLVLHVMVRELTIHKTALNASSEGLIDLIQTLQSQDPFIKKQRKAVKKQDKQKGHTEKSNL